MSKVMGPGPPPGGAMRSSTPKVRSSCQPVLSSVAKIGMAEFRTASAAKAAPVVDKKAIKHVKLNLDMFPLRTELRFLTRINLLRRRFNRQPEAALRPNTQHVHAIKLGLNWHFWTGPAALR